MASLVGFILLVGVMLTVAFVLTPLARHEQDLKPLRRPRPGLRDLHALESPDGDRPGGDDRPSGDDRLARETADDERRCPHCGAVVDDAYSYCGECASPLPW